MWELLEKWFNAKQEGLQSAFDLENLIPIVVLFTFTLDLRIQLAAAGMSVSNCNSLVGSLL